MMNTPRNEGSSILVSARERLGAVDHEVVRHLTNEGLFCIIQTMRLGWSSACRQSYEYYDSWIDEEYAHESGWLVARNILFTVWKECEELLTSPAPQPSHLLP